jgi:hypothetical protein
METELIEVDSFSWFRHIPNVIHLNTLESRARCRNSTNEQSGYEPKDE